MAVGEAFPTGLAFLLAKSSFPSLKMPAVLSQQELGNPVGKAFANRVGVFANSLALLAKRAFPVVSEEITRDNTHCIPVLTPLSILLPQLLNIVFPRSPLSLLLEVLCVPIPFF
jgi:hypothetical protein